MTLINSSTKQENNQEEPELITINVNIQNDSYINEHYEIIDIISKNSNFDHILEEELPYPTNLNNDFDEIDKPSTPINQGIKKRQPPNQKQLYLQAKKLKKALNKN